MNRNPIKWIASAIAVLSLAPVSMLFGMTLLPSRETAQKGGTIVPWLLTWGMISMTVVIAVVLAGFLVITGMSKDAHG